VRLDGVFSCYRAFPKPNSGSRFLFELDFHYKKSKSREKSKYTKEHGMGHDLICLYYFFFNMELHYDSVLRVIKNTSAHLYTLEKMGVGRQLPAVNNAGHWINI